MAVDAAELIGHVKDADCLHLPWGWELHIPQPLEAIGFHITKFMLLEVVAAAVMLAIFIPLGRRVSTGRPLRGRFWNFFEVILIFVRDEVARPAIGRHDASRFVPFLWNLFFFILILNLIGMVPWMGSPTATLGATGALMIVTFCVVVGAGMVKFGPLGYLRGQIPHMDVPVIGILLKIMMFFIEIWGLIVRHVILALRLFANMFAGHLVLAVIVGFIALAAQSWLWYGVMPASVLGATAMSLLELMVAFLQAYVFTFLAALFIGMAVHQH